MYQIYKLVLFPYHSGIYIYIYIYILSYGVVVISTAQLPLTKPELRFSAGSNPACSVSEISDGEDL